jgi:hypothetical protein
VEVREDVGIQTEFYSYKSRCEALQCDGESWEDITLKAKSMNRGIIVVSSPLTSLQ